jgi:hypothetical protein
MVGDWQNIGNGIDRYFLNRDCLAQVQIEFTHDNSPVAHFDYSNWFLI